MTTDYNNYDYIVNGKDGYSLTTALRLWKTKYAHDFKEFIKEVTPVESLADFREFVASVWEEIILVTVEEALKQPNTEDRRNYFDAIGVQQLFKKLDPTLKDRQVIKKKRTRWDNNNDAYEYEFEDVYELYEIDGKKLYEKDEWDNVPSPVFAVRCWCTSTNREYWLYVPESACLIFNKSLWSNRDRPLEYDAVQAIAWTIRLDVKDPERIYRQGDIIVAKIQAEQERTFPYHLSKEEYLKLMYSET